MNDLFDIFSIAFVVSAAATLTFFLKWIFMSIKSRLTSSDSYKRTARHCMEACCVLFSLCIACVAVILIGTQWKLHIGDFLISDYFYYAVLFISILMIIIFFRVLAPVIFGIYVLYCGIFTLLFFQSYSPLPQDYNLTANEGEAVVFQTVSLSYKNLLPLPRFWVSEPKVVLKVDAIRDSEYPIFYPLYEHFNTSSIIGKCILLLESLILDKDTRIEVIDMDSNYEANASYELLVSVNVEKSHIVFETF